MKRALLIIVVVAVVLFALMQLIPVNRTNPAVVREVKWDSPQTQALAQRACYDCHSNQTTYPWYSRIAPVSLFLANHVSEGRDALNFSEWDQFAADAEDMGEQIQRGSMPPMSYLLMHPAARLSDAEKQQLIAGLEATTAADPGGSSGHRGERRGD